MIRLEIKTSDPFETRLASAYWAINSSSFVFELDEVLKKFEIANKKLLVSLVQKYADAWIEGSACPVCRRLKRVKTRTEFLETASLALSRPICQECKDKGLKRPEGKRDNAYDWGKELKPKFNYQFATDAQKIILWALSRINDEAFIHGEMKLAEINELVHYPESSLQKILLSNGQLKVLPPADNGLVAIATARGLSTTSETVEKYVLQSSMRGDGSLLELWKKYCEAEGQRYLLNLTNRAGFQSNLANDLATSLVGIISSALSYCTLETLWYRTWVGVERVKKELGLNPTMADARSILARSIQNPHKNEENRAPWKRVLPLSALGSLLREKFLLTDSSTTETVRLLASKSIPFSPTADDQASPASNEDLSREIFEKAIENGLCSQVMTLIHQAPKGSLDYRAILKDVQRIIDAD